MTVTRTDLIRRLTPMVSLSVLGAALALFLILHPRPAQAAAKIVGDGTAGSCNEATLRAALAGGGDITFSCSAAPNPVVLADFIVITSNTTIDGTNGGNPVTISGGGVTRIFYLDPDVSLSINNLTIRDGARPSGTGGGIYVRGTLIVTNSQFYSNTAEFGGAISTVAGSVVTVTGSTLGYNQATASTGGGLYLLGQGFVSDSRFHHNTALTGAAISAQPGTALTVDNSEIDNNQTLYFAGIGQGAGIRSLGNLTVTASTIHDNVAVTSQSGSRGGGLYHEGGQLVLNDVDFELNRATNGGGVYIASGAGEFTDLTFSQNRAQESSGGGLYVAGSTVTLTGAEFDRNFAGTYGGAIYNGGTLTIVDAVVTTNFSSFGGGGIVNWGNLTLQSSTVSANTASGSDTGQGGGIRNYGTLEAHQVALIGNLAHRDGGGVYNSGSLGLYNAVVLDNVAQGANDFGDTPVYGGGGLYNRGYAVVENTYFARNRTLDLDGGGVYNHLGFLFLTASTLASNTAADDGGGLVNNRGTVGVINVTFSENTASGWGGGLLNDHGSTLLSFATLSGNSAAAGGGLYQLTVYPTATAEIEASLFADNMPGTNCDQFAGSLNVLSGGFNLSDDSSFDPVTGGCPAFGLTDLTNPAPLLGPLSYGSGPTPVHPLLPGSPAIDAIPVDSPDNEECGTDLEFDQRGVARPTEGDGAGPARCDIGAFEYVLGEMAIHLWLPLTLR